MLRFQSNEWFDYGRWVQPPLSGCFWSRWYNTPSVKESFPTIHFHPMLFLDGHSFTKLVDKEAMQKAIAEMDQTNTIGRFIQRIETIGERTKQKHLDVLVSRFDDVDYLKNLFDSYQDMAGFWWMALQLADELEYYIFKKNPELNSSEVVKQVELLRKPTWLEEQSMGVKRLTQFIRNTNSPISPSEVTSSFIQKNKVLSEKVFEHAETYRWFGTHHWGGEPYSIEKCIEEIQKGLNAPATNEATPIVSVELSPLIRLMAALSFWRTHCAEVTAKMVFLSRPRMERLAEKNGLTYETFVYLSNLEIMDALKHGKRLPDKVYERQSKYGSYFDEAGVEHIFVGSELEQLMDKMVEKHDTQLTELKGMVACKGGIICGTAQIVISPVDFERFKEGDILIVPETTPDFVPLMKRASAVITDRGGITSHAAIVSRELGVPCITGTVKATSIFKSGDLIQVDAQKGIIKKRE